MAVIKEISYAGKKLPVSDAQRDEYTRRKDRAVRPLGSFDNARRWYPAAEERCPECAIIRSPSRTYPFSLLTHACTLRHIVLRDYAKEAARITGATCGFGSCDMPATQELGLTSDEGILCEIREVCDAHADTLVGWELGYQRYPLAGKKH